MRVSRERRGSNCYSLKKKSRGGRRGGRDMHRGRVSEEDRLATLISKGKKAGQGKFTSTVGLSGLIVQAHDRRSTGTTCGWAAKLIRHWQPKKAPAAHHPSTKRHTCTSNRLPRSGQPRLLSPSHSPNPTPLPQESPPKFPSPRSPPFSVPVNPTPGVARALSCPRCHRRWSAAPVTKT